MDEEWAERKRRQDFDDLNNEAAGREVGRINRFHPDRDPTHIESKKKENEARVSQLMQMMRDPAYAAAYHRAWDALNDAQSVLDQALLENADEVERLQVELEEMEQAAARLPDGRLVFRAADGSLRDAEGRPLRSEAVPASLIIPSDAPSYESYAAGRGALASARARGGQLSEIQTAVIDPARDRLNDTENPPTAEELADITANMDHVARELRVGRIPTLEQEVQQSHSNRVSELDLPIAPIDLPALD